MKRRTNWWPHSQHSILFQGDYYVSQASSMFFTETLTTKHLWADGEPSVLFAPRAKVTTKLRSEIEKNTEAQFWTCFHPCQFPWFAAGPWNTRDCCSAAHFFTLPELKHHRETILQCVPSRYDRPSPPSRWCYRCHQTFSGRILVHHNYWEGCKVPTHFTLFAGRIGGGLVINGPFVRS